VQNGVQDLVLLITGSTGIAASTAKLAADVGAKLFIISRTEQHCADLQEEICSSGGSCAYSVADLTKAEQIQNAVADCVRLYGRIDSVFNVAGISGRSFGDGPLHECTEQGWDMTMDVNARGMFLVNREVLLVMMEQEPARGKIKGSILNMASVLGYSPDPSFFATHAYAASKGAIIGMSKSMASYYARHAIRVNVIAPALVRTPMSLRAQNNPDILEHMKRRQPLCQDLIEADDVARAAIFLLGSESAMITGEVMAVDAGWCVSPG
jgi:NAD(P)-dependent dehydrogenase (short-subunit alcohol dehydrogenase family)